MSDKKPDKIQRSPRGLLKNTTRYGWDPKHLRLAEVGPGVYVVKPQKSPRQQIADYISFWRKRASSEIKAEGMNPADYAAIAKSDQLDRACTAALVLEQLHDIEIYLRQIEREFGDQPDGPVMIAIHAALLLTTSIHQLDIVGHEIEIESTEKRRQHLKASREAKTKKAARKRGKWQAEADKIWRQHEDWGNSAVAAEIAENDPTAKFDTIRRLIKKPKKIVGSAVQQ
jgi:hypothetical protein